MGVGIASLAFGLHIGFEIFRQAELGRLFCFFVRS